jgi:hypothetical protein
MKKEKKAHLMEKEKMNKTEVTRKKSTNNN